MKKILFLAIACLLTMTSYGQKDIKKDSLGGVVSADQVKIQSKGSRRERTEAGIRAKAKELVRDLLERQRLQFEPEYGRYHGIYRNLNNEKFTKKAANTMFTNNIGTVSGWHEDNTGGEFTGKPVIQIFNDHFYCNLDVLLRAGSTMPNKSARSTAVTKITQQQGDVGTTQDPKNAELNYEYIDTYDSEEDNEMDLVVFNTENFEITNIQNVNEYTTTFDVIVKQPFEIENTFYDHFIFQCAMNVLDGRMAVRIIAGDERICTTYHGDMNYIQGGSF